MLKYLEDITVLSAEEFLGYEGELIFVDTECPFASQPMAQVYLALGEAEDKLPAMWQEASIFGDDVFTTYEPGVLHTFISLNLQSMVEPGQYLFVKVILVGEPQKTLSIKRD